MLRPVARLHVQLVPVDPEPGQIGLQAVGEPGPLAGVVEVLEPQEEAIAAAARVEPGQQG